ncbi:MAG: NifB/NifX family molybdenum-iron cluster-binding protein [Treponema sp.]|nr:NifB/NifX family molybdenum-iron cluster-binding protein [Treponema sp.]
MRIAVPADEKMPETAVSVSFGRAPFFSIYDTEDQSYTVLPNPGADASGGAGIKAAQAVVDDKVQAVITFRCGENAAKVLEAAGIILYTAESGSVSTNVLDCAAGKLPVLASVHPGFHNHRSNA